MGMEYNRIKKLEKFKKTIKTTANLTDNSAGTADDTIAAMPNAVAASTDATAAQLVSVNTTFLALRNNIADLTAKVNALLTASKA